MHKPSDFHLQIDYYQSFNLLLLSQNQYRDIPGITMNTVDEIVSIAHR